jgi:hypothetical protein
VQVVPPADSAMTARYEALLIEQLTGSDAHASEVAITCENMRLVVRYGLHRMRGPLKAAVARAQAHGTQRRLREIDSELANHVITAGKGCDSLARAGVLGGPWPSDSDMTASAKRDFPE